MTQALPVVAHGEDGLRALIGQTVGPGPWVEVAQGRVDAFADATDDHQWIHVDPERAAHESSFGGTIAHGFLTLSLIPGLMRDVLSISGFAMSVNYGCNKVRFPAPLPVGTRVRLSLVIDDVTALPMGVQTTITASVHQEAGSKPVCVATLIGLRVLG